MLIDTHAHVMEDQFNSDRGEALERAWSAGLSAFIEIGERESQWGPARTLSESHPGKIYWTAGLHPYYAEEADAAFNRRLASALSHPQCVAVGEIGLDYHRENPSRDRQRSAFESLLETALAAGKPAVIHCREKDKVSRDAQEDMLAIFRRLLPTVPGNPGVLHCFQGSADLAPEFSAYGFFFGADGPLTYPNAGELRGLFQKIPLENVVLETDSPYLPPQERRGRRNEPSFLPSVARRLAELKGETLEAVGDITTQNARRLFRIP